MKTLRGLESLQEPLVDSVLTIGNFDGVHRAHQALLAHARRQASSGKTPLVVLTFEPHPLSIVAPGKTPPRLIRLEEKLDRLAAAGTDLVVVAESRPALLGLDAERFVEEVLVARFRPKHIVEGPSFGFGRGRKGNPELLQRLASRYGYELHIVEPVYIELDDGQRVMVSSSLVRRLIGEGDVEQAARCLGRPCALWGLVVAGEGRGRTLGVPTANVAVADLLIPAEGVYAARAVVRGDTFMSAVSIGRAPTFGGSELRVEAHLIDFEGDLYGQAMRLEFDRRLRSQRSFDSAESLKAQLRRDIETVRQTRDSGRRRDARQAAVVGSGHGDPRASWP